jgi:hypothetical protein
MNIRARNGFAFLLFVTMLLWQSANFACAQPIVLNFDELEGMQYFPLAEVPKAAQLSDQYLKTHGVRFSSKQPYVAVSRLGPGHAVSGINAIAGVDANGILTYDHVHPIVVRFFNPSNPNEPATTDFVSVRVDLWGSGIAVDLKAFTRDGKLIDSCTVVERGGETLKVSGAGIHYVEFHGGQGVALDDFTFNPVTPREKKEEQKDKEKERVPVPIVVQEKLVLELPAEPQGDAPLPWVWIGLICAVVLFVLALLICIAVLAIFLHRAQV